MPKMKLLFMYAAALAAGTFLLKWIQYYFLVHQLRIEFYMALIAVGFTSMGIWAGIRLNNRRTRVEPITQGESIYPSAATLEPLGLSARELDVLHHLVKGHTNQEIADELFVSVNTVKTHTSNLYSKLGVQRRTQAIRKAEELGLSARTRASQQS